MNFFPDDLTDGSMLKDDFIKIVEEIQRHSTDSLPPIRFIPFETFKNFGTFPRYPEEKELCVQLELISRDKAFIVFISHCWLRGWPGAEGWDGRPHPDAVGNEKYNLCVAGIERALKSLAPGMEECFVWLDFSCIDQNGNPAGELKQLDKIVQASDCIFTPIYDTEIWDLPRVVKDMYSEYKSKLWNDGPHSYLKRGWCRVEMLYAAIIPLFFDESSSITASSEEKDAEATRKAKLKARNSKFAACLQFHSSNGRRPHLLYGSNEHRRKNEPIALPPLQFSYFSKYNPLEGTLSVESDREHIKKLLEDLEPYKRELKEGYKGQTNAKGEYHGKGVYRFDSGDVYEGQWENGLKHGRGRYRYASGAVYDGEFRANKMNGHGTYTFASGVFYDGDFKDGKKCGQGSYHYSSGDVYTGSWRGDRKNGQGVYRYSSGDVYSGEFKEDLKSGTGKMQYSDGGCYEGEWKEDKKHGQGCYNFPNGDIYSGSYKDGERHGKGRYKAKDGEFVEGHWEHGVRLTGDKSLGTKSPRHNDKKHKKKEH